MLKRDFIILVKAELDNIRTKATKEEKAKLDFRKLDINDGTLCIYGQMTGSCESKRAIKLQKKTFNAVFNNPFDPDRRLYSVQNMEKGRHYTALEKYLYIGVIEKDDFKIPKHNKIIQYIKGEVNEIKL